MPPAPRTVKATDLQTGDVFEHAGQQYVHLVGFTNESLGTQASVFVLAMRREDYEGWEVDQDVVFQFWCDHQVAVVPGSAFGPSGEGFVRASLATSYEGLETALGRIERFIGSLG